MNGDTEHTVPAPPPFIGRHKELAALRAAYESPGSAFWPVYGRRRVGKSALIRHFAEPHPSIFLVGKRGAPAEQLMRELLRAAAVTLEEPLLADAPVDNWKQVIQTIVGRWKGGRKLILVLDEFQWIAEKSPELASVLQELWDVSWQHNGRIFLILCGSYIGFMMREVLGSQSPLFGRRTGQIFLKPFSYREAALFIPSASLLQKATTYLICGGIPLYLRYFPASRPVLSSIEQALLTDVASLYTEPDFLLREELREIDKYYMILTALSTESQRVKEISRHSGIEERSLHYYLDQLIGLGYIEKRYPLTGEAPQTHSVRYRLVDPLLRFWFHFVYPNTSLLAQIGPARVAAEIIRPRLDSYFGICFDSLCREALPVLYERERLLTPFQIGSYWGTGCQIDVVGLREDGWTDLGECKFGADDSATAAAELARKAGLYPNKRGATICKRLFMRSYQEPHSPLPEGIKLHTLEDLY